MNNNDINKILDVIRDTVSRSFVDETAIKAIEVIKDLDVPSEDKLRVISEIAKHSSFQRTASIDYLRKIVEALTGNRPPVESDEIES